MKLSLRMSLVLVLGLLLFAFPGAAGTTVDITTPMPAPEWARLQRRIVADSVAAAKSFFGQLGYGCKSAYRTE